MKRIFIILVAVLLTASVFAQAPQKISYQAVIRNSSDALVTNTQIGMKISILQGSISGTLVYEEIYNPNPSTNANGLVNIEIGGGVPLFGTFATIDWSAESYYIKTETDLTGGTNYSITGTSQLLSVPYALHAKTAETVIGEITITETDPIFGAWDKDYADLTNAPTIPTVPVNVGDFTNDVGYLTDYTELDPVFGAWDKDYADLTNTPTIPTVPVNVGDFTNDVGYLTDYTETDPVFGAWDKDYADLTNTPTIPTVPVNVGDFTNDVGYLTSFIETDPVFTASASNGITSSNIINWNTAYGWGNHATVGYLTSFTETDPVFTASPSNGITSSNIVNWNNAYAWGNHAGLYRPITWVPSWTDITGKPTFATVATSGSYTDLSNKPITDGSETKVTAGTNVTVTGLGTTASPYIVGNPTLTIGQSYQGGIIFWLDATGQHGLIAATVDQSTGIQWYNSVDRYTGTTGDGLYAGEMNTAMIVAAQISDNQTGNFAAKVCADYSVTVSGINYGDWYLPSKYELNLLYLQKNVVGGFADEPYWSSTELSDSQARLQYFNDGYQSINAKSTTTSYVRAIRSF